MAPLQVTDLLERNKKYVAGNHQPIPYFSELKTLPSLIIVTCVDPRLIPEQFLSLNVGGQLSLNEVEGSLLTWLTCQTPLSAVTLGDELQQR